MNEPNIFGALIAKVLFAVNVLLQKLHLNDFPPQPLIITVHEIVAGKPDQTEKFRIWKEPDRRRSGFAFSSRLIWYPTHLS